jgi:hypothetical protein
LRFHIEIRPRRAVRNFVFYNQALTVFGMRPVPDLIQLAIIFRASAIHDPVQSGRVHRFSQQRRILAIFVAVALRDFPYPFIRFQVGLTPVSCHCVMRRHG